MIKCDYLTTRSDGVILVKTYSTENKYIKQVETGLEYDQFYAKAKEVAAKQKSEWIENLTDRVNHYFTLGFRYTY